MKPGIWIALSACCAFAQPALSPADHGRAIYRSNCAFCHGTEGRGGRGPNLVSAPLNHGDSDADLARVIRGGVPGSSMPAFQEIEKDDLRDLIAHLRQLSGGSERQPVRIGDASAGKRVYDRAGCAGCHRIGNDGSTYGPELTRVGSGRSLEHLRESLVKPSADIPAEWEGVAVTLKNGKTVRGVRVNEDTFTVQVREPNERYRGFVKSEVSAVQPLTESLMPSYSKLAVDDLNNLLQYLTTLRGEAVGATRKAEGIR